jgi:hypothetical protein
MTLNWWTEVCFFEIYLSTVAASGFGSDISDYRAHRPLADFDRQLDADARA